MANILLLDDSDVAGSAMQGILARGNHTCFVADDTEKAWRMLREAVVFDLVILEVKLLDGSGLAFLQRLRADWFWKVLPVVVYSAETNSSTVKRALSLDVQNYLLKPYNAELIYAEITKALQNPWRNLHFEDAKSFCALMGLKPEVLTQMRRDVMLAFDKAAQTYPSWTEKRQNQEVFAQLTALASDAESAGIWAGVDFLRHLHEQATLANWYAFQRSNECLDYASRLIFCHLNPSYVPEAMRSEAQKVGARAATERARWDGADVDAGGPVVSAAALLKQVDGLGGCPVVDTTAAGFQMVSDGRDSGMAQVMDLVATDPGLSAQILAAANKVGEMEDPRAAASVLGEVKLSALARHLPLIDERHFDAPPFTWAGYWMYQVAVGRVAQFICSYLELDYLSSNAYTAGLLQDIGKLILLKLHPYSLQAIMRHARDRKLSLSDAERKYLGCTTRELSVHLATTQGLPLIYVNVMRWVETPALATNNMDLVAIVSLARHVCLHARVGCSGDTPGPNAALASTPAWSMLKASVFPSFDLKKFEVQAHAYCLTLRNELSGQRGERRPSHAQRSAELV